MLCPETAFTQYFTGVSNDFFHPYFNKLNIAEKHAAEPIISGK
jgi:hypothetical protein